LHFKAFSPLLFFWTVGVEAKIPWAFSPYVNEQEGPTAALTEFSSGLGCATLWQWKRCFAGVLEVVGAPDEAFSCSSGKQYHEFACVTVRAFADDSFLQPGFLDSIAQSFANDFFFLLKLG